jgi:hypothetical protein
LSALTDGDLPAELLHELLDFRLGMLQGKRRCCQPHLVRGLVFFFRMVCLCVRRTSRNMQGGGHLPPGLSQGGIGRARGRQERQTLRGSVRVPSTSVPAGEGWDHSSVLGQSSKKIPLLDPCRGFPNSRGIPLPYAPIKRVRGEPSCKPVAHSTDKGRQGCTNRTAQAYCRGFSWAFVQKLPTQGRFTPLLHEVHKKGLPARFHRGENLRAYFT